MIRDKTDSNGIAEENLEEITAGIRKEISARILKEKCSLRKFQNQSNANGKKRKSRGLLRSVNRKIKKML